VKEVQFLRILGLERRAVRDVPSPVTPPDVDLKKAVKSATIVQKLSDRFMNLVSIAYKRTAFVLLFTLFVAFVFYGVLIAFFLLSSGWGAPLTLTRGHELVNKVEREITEVSVALNQTEQRLSESALARISAEQELQDAEGLVGYAKGTVKKELVARTRQVKVLTQSIKRLTKVQGQLLAQVNGNGASADLERLYKKRLIDRNAYSAGAMNVVEASQRLAAVEIEIDQGRSQIEEFSSSKEMLLSLQSALNEGKSVLGISASASDLLLLAKQSSDALSARALAQSKLENTKDNTEVLLRSIGVLQSQLKTLETSALARARDKRIDVVFVPYGNERNFKQGDAVYSCTFTILWCSLAGTVGQQLPGEINSVHPFFGKPIRGSFVELKLSSPDAAMRETIHGTRKPLFF
jgi:hypothetical protein